MNIANRNTNQQFQLSGLLLLSALLEASPPALLDQANVNISNFTDGAQEMDLQIDYNMIRNTQYWKWIFILPKQIQITKLYVSVCIHGMKSPFY